MLFSVVITPRLTRAPAAPPVIVPVLFNVVIVPLLRIAEFVLEIVPLFSKVVMTPDERIAWPPPEIEPLFVNVVIVPELPMPLEAFPEAVIEECLGHKVGTEVQRAYRRTDVLEQRRLLMEEWSTFIEPSS